MALPAYAKALGLDRFEAAGFRRLHPEGRAVILEELREPQSRLAIRRILSHPDPARALQEEIAYNTRLAIRGVKQAIRSGMGDSETADYCDGLGFSLKKTFKKVTKAVQKVVQKVAAPIKAIHAKIIPKPLQKIEKKVVSEVHRAGQAAQRIHESAEQVAKRLGTKSKQVVKKVWVKYGNTIIGVLGAVLAPFTFGASSAAAALIIAANNVYQAKRAATRAKAAGRADAAQMQAAVDAQEKDLGRQADEIYAQYPDAFRAIGITPEKWASLSTQAKLAIIESLSKGQLPPGYSYVSESEAAAAGVPGALPGGSPGASSGPGQPKITYTSGDGGGGGSGGGGGGGGHPSRTPIRSSSKAGRSGSRALRKRRRASSSRRQIPETGWKSWSTANRRVSS